MYKKDTINLGMLKGYTYKILLIMRLTTVILIATMTQVSAAGFAQKISLSKSNAPLKSVLKELKSQSGYIFLYTDNLLKLSKPVDIKVNGADFEDVLKLVFENQPLTYSINESTITVKEKEKGFFESLVDRFNAIDVRGKILDEKGDPLVGATVSIKGKNKSVKTDQNGAFYLENVDESDKLVISYIGYQVQEMLAKADLGSVSLQVLDAKLAEVEINAGYYLVKDKERTGSITRVTAEDIAKAPVSNPLSALQGRMAGVNISQNTGVPGGAFKVQIRGRNSLRPEGNMPLYIVDGMPYASENRSDPNASSSILDYYGISPLNALNPSDIESIDVLKDADATSIYGSRGANGVVLITTKKGKAGKTNISVNAFSGTATVTRTTDMMNTEQYLKVRFEGFANDGITEFPEGMYDVNGTWDQNRSTDWQKELIGGTSLTNNIDLGISGGDTNTQFLLHGTSYKETTVFPGDFAYRKSAAHATISHTSDNKKLTANLSLNYVADKNDLPGQDLTRIALQLSPNAPELYNENGELNWENNTWDNPVAVLKQTYLAKTNNLTAAADLGYIILPGLQFRTSLGYTDNRLEESRKTPNTINNPAYGTTTATSTLIRNTSGQKSWIIEPQLSYEHIWGKGKLNLLSGATFQERIDESFAIRARGFSSNALMDNPAAATTLRILGYNKTEYRYNAVFGRVNYGYNDKYFLNLTGRRDGSSRFGTGNRFANFGAVGAAWLFGKEKVINETLSALSFGKLRASYGTTGSDQIGDYQFIDTYAPTGVVYGTVVGMEPLRLYNPEFSWEFNKKLEMAIDLGFFNDRIFLTAAHYRNRSSSQLVGLPLPGTTGFQSIQANLAATVQNTGWEFELRSANVRKKDFNWSTSLNLTVAQNKLIEFPDLDISTYANQYVIGESLDILKTFHYTGIDPENHLYGFKDFNGDGQITRTDSQQIVNLTPQYYGGLQNSISYKNWQFDFLLQFVKQKGYNYTYTAITPGIFANLPADLADSWEVQQYTAGFNDNAINAFYRYLDSDGALSDASYVRLKNASLSYTLPKSWVKASSCRIYIQGQNLLTMTHFKGSDPENQTNGALPPLKVITVGVEFNFQP